MSLQNMVRSAQQLNDISAYLNALGPDERLQQALSLGKNEQQKLYDLAQGYLSLTLESVVPKETKPMQKVTHEGRNSLPAFSAFAKVFYRPEATDFQSEMWGYNRTTSFVTNVVGPGYYVAKAVNGEIVIDYTKVPKASCPGGPEYRKNGERLSRFVYAEMQDTLRGVSDHVTIGRATRHGQIQNNWFILCRT